MGGFHTIETINVAGFPQGSWSNSSTQIEVGTASVRGTRQWTTVVFNTTFSTPPAVITSLQTANGGDAVDVHVRNISKTSMQIALFEEQRKMGSGYIPETVGYLLVASDTNGFDLGNPQSTRIELPYSILSSKGDATRIVIEALKRRAADKGNYPALIT